jgi:hypothetical protein
MKWCKHNLAPRLNLILRTTWMEDVSRKSTLEDKFPTWEGVMCTNLHLGLFKGPLEVENPLQGGG